MAFLLQSPKPPITRTTLDELNMDKMFKNLKLRHDLNFIPSLELRQDLNPEKVKRRHHRATVFWETLRFQLDKFMVNREELQESFTQLNWCLPLLLQSVKDIIQTLIPVQQWAELDEAFNVEWIMQQLARGIADLGKLASWLSGVLKSHCAPVRDVWIDEMYSKLTDEEDKIHGLQSLLSILEAMRLDLINHQIQHYRIDLIRDTVEFEQNLFKQKIETGLLEPSQARKWYCLAANTYKPSAASEVAFGEMKIFFEALCKSILPSSVIKLPNNFYLDKERITRLKSEVLDIVNLGICARLLVEREKEFNRPSTLSRSTQGLCRHSDIFNKYSSTSNICNGMPRLSYFPAESTYSSIRSFTSIPLLNDSIAERMEYLVGSLKDFLNTFSTSNESSLRWKNIQNFAALQILRLTNGPSDEPLNVNRIEEFEDKLHHHLNTPESSYFQEIERDLHSRLLAEVQNCVTKFKNLSEVGMFAELTVRGGSQVRCPYSRMNSRVQEVKQRTSNNATYAILEQARIEDLATSLSHLGIIHWRVWSSLVYYE